MSPQNSSAFRTCSKLPQTDCATRLQRCPMTARQRSPRQLLPLGIGADSIFARHARETFIAVRADATIDENVAIQRELDDTVANLVRTTQDGVERGTAALTDTLNHSRILLLIVAIASIVAAVGVGILYVQRRLVERLISISNAMRQLAAGDVDSALPSISTRDEMGEMSRALQVLHAGEIGTAQAYRTRAGGTADPAPAGFVGRQHHRRVSRRGEFRGHDAVDQRFGDGDDGARTFGHRQRSRRPSPRGFAFVRDDVEQRAHCGRRDRRARRFDPRDQQTSRPDPRRRQARRRDRALGA